MLRFSRGRGWLAAAALLLAGAAPAATISFNGANFPACPLSGQTYTCPTLPLGPTDTAAIASGYTVVVNSGIALSSGQGVQMSGSAKLQTSGGNAMDLSGSQNLNITGGTLAAGGNFKLGSSAQSITANVTAASVNTGGASTYINGTVTASGAINLGSSSTITGAVGGGSISTSSSINLGPLTISGAINLGSSNTINGAVSGASISTNSSVNMGALTISGAVDLGSSNAINGSISAASIRTNSSVTITGSVSTPGGLADLGSGIKIGGGVTAGSVKTNSPGQIGGTINSAGTVDLGSSITVGGNVSGTTISTNSPVNITGNVTASTSFTLSSGSSVTGNVTAPVVTLNPSNVTVKGNIAASTSLDIGSGNTVNGNVGGGSLILRPSNATINGNATFTGDVDMGSGTTINGDLAARNVTTHSSNATINGNAAVNAIYLDWGASVTKTITCTGAAPGAPVCSCVTKADSNYKPTCGAAAPVGGPHHIQISHSGQALTCQPQTVTLTACANATCALPHYSASTAVTLLPGGKQFNITGGVNNAATVEQSDVGTATLSATSNASNGFTCVNSSDAKHPCDMVFEKSGLTVSADNHISMTPDIKITVRAMTAAANNQSCVPLVADKTVKVDMYCTYSDPISGTLTPQIGTSNLTCDGGATATEVSLKFDKDGLATADLAYPDVGKIDLSAKYTYKGTGTAFNAASGSASFITAPKEFQVVAVSAGASTAKPHDIFAKASEAFTVTVTAVNAADATVKNFGKEKKKEGVKFAYSVVNPADAGNNGKLTIGQFEPFDNGVYSSKSGSDGKWSFSDVGTVNLTLTLANDTDSSATTYYMGYSGLNTFATKGALDIARFIPDHFDTVLVTDSTMDCTNLIDGVKPCVDTSTRFTHAKQPFLIKVLAYNGAAPPALTSNYAGIKLAKPVTLSAWNALGGDKAADRGTLQWTAPNPADATASADPKFAFAKSTGTGVLSHQQAPAILPYFDFIDAYPLKIPPATIYLRAVDTDGVSSKRAVAADSVEAPLTAVSGRLLLSNAHGSQNSPLPVEASAQYYMPSGYVFNPQVQAVSATKIAGKIAFTNCQNKLDTGSGNCPATLKVVNDDFLTLLNGKGTFRLAPPTPALIGNGSVNVSLGSLFDYLPSTIGRATFGIYRSGPVIYTREVHN